MSICGSGGSENCIIGGGLLDDWTVTECSYRIMHKLRYNSSAFGSSSCTTRNTAGRKMSEYISLTRLCDSKATVGYLKTFSGQDERSFLYIAKSEKITLINPTCFPTSTSNFQAFTMYLQQWKDASCTSNASITSMTMPRTNHGASQIISRV